MSKIIITEQQKQEIVKLSEKHQDALIALGGDMYRRGIKTGIAYAACGVAISFVIHHVSELFEKKNDTPPED